MSFEAGSLQRSLRITLDHSLDVASYRRRFEVSSNVRDVLLKVQSSSEEDEVSESVKTLFRGLRDLKKLKALSFESVEDEISRPGSVPLQTITVAVTHARNLKDLFIGNIVLRGSTEQNLSAFTSVLRRRRSLEEFSLVGCQFPTATRSPSLDPMVRGIAYLPQIRVVHLQARSVNHLGTLTSPAVSALCVSKTLKELKLFQFDLTDDQFMTASRSLESNNSLEELSLGVCNFTIVTTAALAKMLRRNSILRWLELAPKQQIEDKLLVQIAEAVEENSSLQHLALDGRFGPLSQPVKDAFERMLEENYLLKTLRLFDTPQTQPEFHMYIRLNRVGRNHLLDPKSSANRSDWLHAIHSVIDSLDCIYYCISVNPFLCHTTEELQTQVRVARRGHKRRRLNDDPDKTNSENSSSVNSSLSSSENSSSPSGSEERQTSTDTSDNLPQNATGGGHQVTSTSESSNTKDKEERSSSDQPSSNPAAETSTSAGSRNDSPAEDANGTQQHQQAPSQQAVVEQGAVGSQNDGHAQTQTFNPAISVAAGQLFLTAGLQAMAQATQAQPQQPANVNPHDQLLEQLQKLQGMLQHQQPQQQQKPPQQQQMQPQPMVQASQPQTQSQSMAQASQPQTQQTMVQASQAQSQPQQLHQQIVNAPANASGNQANQLMSLAFPLLMSSFLQQSQAGPQGAQPGQAPPQPQVQQPQVMQQMQQVFTAAGFPQFAANLPQAQQMQQQSGQPMQQQGQFAANQPQAQQMQQQSGQPMQQQGQFAANPPQAQQMQQQSGQPLQQQGQFAANQPQAQQMQQQSGQPMQQQGPQQMQGSQQFQLQQGVGGQDLQQQQSQPYAQGQVSVASSAAVAMGPTAAGQVAGATQNSFPLYMPRDQGSLSSYQCFLRQQIELFEAGPEDVKSTMPGRNKAIVLGQVGIRCRHCAMLPSRYRGTGATYYPAKLDRLYQAAQNMAQTHFGKHCRHIPQEINNELAVLLQGSKSSAGAGKKYWSDGARMLGVYEHEADEILRLDRSRATA
ncbi:expressed unknown protein [Seminavis robusta]|uniref:Uncharacterized protein n=1 Tax=Seminavis robusta TaxID=568900 RepID=A0A9N8HTR0_9STRA|nr:expressed unknown protein [Seminavis robusta]|eukprot:Sro1543_g281150.1 n/a (1019) ;mRNA; r:12127-15271